MLTALRDPVAAFAGYGFVALLEGEEVLPGQSSLWRKGKVLRFLPKGKGVRAYLAVAGSFQARPFLGSVSPDLRGRVGRPLRAGEVLGVGEVRLVRPGQAFPLRPLPEPFRLRLRLGPDFSREALRAFLAGPFRVARADRMGVELLGLEVPGGEGLSKATPLGGRFGLGQRFGSRGRIIVKTITYRLPRTRASTPSHRSTGRKQTPRRHT